MSVQTLPLTRSFFLRMAAVMLLPASTCLAGDNSIPNATPETFVGGPENLEMVQTATSVTVFRIVSRAEKLSPEAVVTIDKQQCHASSVEVTGGEVERVVAALSDMTNFGGMFTCDFDPGVILRFADEKHTLDLIICFRCGEMILYQDQVVVRRPYQWAATKNSFRREARRAFTAIAKKAFPKDAEIQALK